MGRGSIKEEREVQKLSGHSLAVFSRECNTCFSCGFDICLNTGSLGSLL